MVTRVVASLVLALLAVPIGPTISVLAAGPATKSQENTILATPTLVREIQFMLLTVGIDPGPIDGNAQQRTKRAALIFQERSGLQASELVTNAPISSTFVDRLRKEAAQILLKDSKTEAAVPPGQFTPTSPATPPAEVAALRPEPPPPVAPPTPAPPDRFAGCPFNADDLHIGGRQYTAQGFLDEGFEGSTARAVTSLRQRLDEARQLAKTIGGAAMTEVQRQARVLSYFECRLKIEQASAGKN